MSQTTEDHEHLIESQVKIYLDYSDVRRRWEIAMTSADGHPLDEVLNDQGRAVYRCRYQSTHAKLPEGPERSQVFADCELLIRDALNVQMPTLVELITQAVDVLSIAEEADVARAYVDNLAIEAGR